MIRPAPKTYNIHEAKTQLSRLLAEMSRGDEVIIARAGVPVARLVPVESASRERVLGTERGKLVIADNFDAPLPPDVLDDFEG